MPETRQGVKGVSEKFFLEFLPSSLPIHEFHSLFTESRWRFSAGGVCKEATEFTFFQLRLFLYLLYFLCLSHSRSNSLQCYVHYDKADNDSANCDAYENTNDVHSVPFSGESVESPLVQTRQRTQQL